MSLLGSGASREPKAPHPPPHGAYPEASPPRVVCSLEGFPQLWDWQQLSTEHTRTKKAPNTRGKAIKPQQSFCNREVGTARGQSEGFAVTWEGRSGKGGWGRWSWSLGLLWEGKRDSRQLFPLKCPFILRRTAHLPQPHPFPEARTRGLKGPGAPPSKQQGVGQAAAVLQNPSPNQTGDAGGSTTSRMVGRGWWPAVGPPPQVSVLTPMLCSAALALSSLPAAPINNHKQ